MVSNREIQIREMYKMIEDGLKKKPYGLEYKTYNNIKYICNNISDRELRYFIKENIILYNIASMDAFGNIVIGEKCLEYLAKEENLDYPICFEFALYHEYAHFKYILNGRTRTLDEVLDSPPLSYTMEDEMKADAYSIRECKLDFNMYDKLRGGINSFCRKKRC